MLAGWAHPWRTIAAMPTANTTAATIIAGSIKDIQIRLIWLRSRSTFKTRCARILFWRFNCRSRILLKTYSELPSRLRHWRSTCRGSPDCAAWMRMVLALPAKILGRRGGSFWLKGFRHVQRPKDNHLPAVSPAKAIEQTNKRRYGYGKQASRRRVVAGCGRAA